MEREDMELRYIEVARLRPNPLNPREDYGDVEALAQSIAAVGLTQPLIVRPGDDGTFVVVAGHRRLKALTEHACCEGIRRVPCFVDASGGWCEVASLMSDNSNRKDFTFAEAAAGVQRMLELDMPDDMAAKASGCDEKSVAAMGRAVRGLRERGREVPTMDFFSAQAIDDFAGDEAAVDELLDAWREDPDGGIARRYWALRAEREAEARRFESERRMAESGAAVVGWDEYAALRDANETRTYLPGVGQVTEKGCGCEGFCAAVNPGDGRVVWFCRKPRNHDVRDEGRERRERLHERMRDRLRYAFGLVACGREGEREAAESIARGVYEAVFREEMTGMAEELGVDPEWKPKGRDAWVLHAFVLAEMESQRRTFTDFAEGLQSYNKDRWLPRYDAWATYLLDLQDAGYKADGEERQELREVIEKMDSFDGAEYGE